MSTTLDLYDIQGDVVKAYGRFGFPKARYVFYHIHKGAAGRDVIKALIPTITNGAPWGTAAAIPPTSTNMSFTYEGLKQLGVPDLSLHSFPDEFSMGMKARRDILDDTGVNAPKNWDPIWSWEKREQPVHMLIAINGKNVELIEKRYQEICTIVAQSQGGVEQLIGHRGEDRDDLPYQEGTALFVNGQPVPKEHFGYTDGISETYFRGSGAKPETAIGGGKPTRGDPSTLAGWEPLETGEFLLGHKDEAFEYPLAPMPSLLARNGTFMVYRKLHQNVGTFNAFLNRVGATFPGGKEALAAKFVGRWRNGAPLTTFPTEADANKFIAEYMAAQAKARQPGASQADRDRYAQLRIKLVGFNFNDDLEGVRCPTGAHIRRVNPRGSLEFGHKKAFETPGALDNRRRILRRGLPYGEVKDPSSDEGNHGIIVMLLNASIKRQFEFVQQQWIAYGNDFKLANDKDPILGNHGHVVDHSGAGRMIIQADPRGDKPPFLCGKMPTFVEMRGGDYFFIPSLTALQLIGDGAVDPT